MRSAWSLTLSLVAALFVVGCECGSGESRSCRTDSDCRSGERCVDRACVRDEPLDGGGDARVEAPDAERPDAAPECSPACEDGSECIGGACCDAEDVCGGACCGEGEVCSFLACVPIGAPCRSEDDCAEGEYCEPLLGEPMLCEGTTISTGRCLPRPPRCPDGTLPDPAMPTCVASCTFEPEADVFDVELAYAWGSYDGDPAAPNPSDVRNAPIVIQMDDDDCDGRITGRDVPEIVIVTAPDDAMPEAGDLVVLSVVAGELREKWRVPGMAHAHRYLSAGNIDGMPGNEIVVCGAGTTVRAYGVERGLLVERWETDTPANCNKTSIADLDQDGRPEVLVGGVALAGEDGSVRFTFDAAWGSEVIAMDVDGDAAHDLEVVSGSRIFDLEGGAFVTRASLGFAGGAYPIVADLVPGGLPEIVSVHNATHTLTVWRYDGAGGVTVLRRELDINGSLDPTLCPATSVGRTRGGGPPTAADVNADGIPDIAVAGGVGYAVLDGARLVDPAVADLETFFWAQDTIDCSSARTGSSVFDFNGDGRAEVLYGDEHFFRVYEGMTGRVLFEVCNTNGTIEELPIVADVDADGQADIVVVANARHRACMDGTGDRVSGVRVYGSPGGRWVRTRPVWNQHAYHVTHVEADGTIPVTEAPNWSTEGLNNFRQNRQPGTELGAVDAVIAIAPACGAEPGVIATVRNLGEAVLPAGAIVRLYRGGIVSMPDPGDLLAEVTTATALYPAQAVDVLLGTSEPGVVEGTTPVHAVVVVPDDVPECRGDNNTADTFTRGCLI